VPCHRTFYDPCWAGVDVLDGFEHVYVVALVYGWECRSSHLAATEMKQMFGSDRQGLTFDEVDAIRVWVLELSEFLQLGAAFALLIVRPRNCGFMVV
jgi:hypothetical protein